jgi:hypothetical protein
MNTAQHYGLEMPIRTDRLVDGLRRASQAQAGNDGKKVTARQAEKRHERIEKEARTLDSLRFAAMQANGNGRGQRVDFSYTTFFSPSLLPLYKYLTQSNPLDLLLRAFCYQQALSETNMLIPFSFNLSEALLDQTNKSARNGLTDFVRRSLARNLKRSLGFDPQFWFAVEFNRPIGIHSQHRARPHVHGALAANPNDADKIRQAFHRANVDYQDPDFKKRAIQLHIKTREASKDRGGDFVWATYALKDAMFTRLYLPDESIITADQRTRNQAKAIYEAMTGKTSSKKILSITPELPADQVADDDFDAQLAEVLESFSQPHPKAAPHFHQTPFR